MSVEGIYWIASYPKSGNTWVRLLLSSLHAGGRSPDLKALGQLSSNSASFSWIESILDVSTVDMTPAEHTCIRAETFRTLPYVAKPPFWLKIHDRYDVDLIPAEVTAGIVYVVRDPRDVVPSWADHMGISLDTAIERMGRPDFTVSQTALDLRPQAQQRLGSWSDNVRSWLDSPHHPLLLLRYEDMLANPAAAVSKLAAFLKLPTNRDIVAAAIEACAFAALQAAEAANGFNERMEHQERFFRQGRAGAWHGALTPEQAARVWDDHHEMMVRLGYGPGGTDALVAEEGGSSTG